MCASCTDSRRLRRVRGFTLVELIAVLLMVAVLAVVALPRFDGAMALRGAGWREKVLVALRHAHSVAQGHRRLVCVAVSGGAVTLTIASTHPAGSCDATLPGPDGHASFAHDAAAPATTSSPAGTLYFQPSGRVTSDAAGASAVNASIAIAGEEAIALVGETGHVQ